MSFFIKYRKQTLYALSFFLPLLIGGIGYAVRGIAPFGTQSLAAIDGFGQYFPMLREAERHFFHPAAWSFSGAFGFSFYAQSAYYTNSPLNILLFLLPGKVQVWEMDLLVLLRFGLMSLSFFHLLSKHYCRLTWTDLPLSLSWAFSGYSLAFINQIMWMDALILLPLLVLSLYRLLNEGKCLRYGILLFLLIISCFYIAYMVCLFLILFSLVILLSEQKKSFRQALLALLLFAGVSLLSGLLSLPFLLPLLRAIRETAAANASAPAFFSLMHPLSEVLLRFLPFQEASLAYGAPNFYFGLFSLVPLLFAFLSSSLPRRKKLLSGTFVLFLLLSALLSGTDYLWHGFHEPSQLPGRESFLLIFLILFFSGSGISEIRSPKKKLLIALLLAAEITGNAVFQFQNVPCVTASHVAEADESLTRLRAEISPELPSGEFFRTEISPYRDNGGQLYGYAGISYYSSTMPEDAYLFFQALGVSRYAGNVSVRFESRTSGDFLYDLFSVRRILKEDGTLLENSDALPLLVVCDRKVLADFSDGAGSLVRRSRDIVWETGEEMLSGPALQNRLLQSMSARSEALIDEEAHAIQPAYGRALSSLSAYGNVLIETIRENVLFTEIRASADIKKEGSLLLMSLPSSNVSLWVDGEKVPHSAVLQYMAACPLDRGPHDLRIRLLP